MRSFRWLIPVLVLIVGAAMPDRGHAQGCALEQVKLVCGEKSDLSQFKALGSDKTGELFDDPLVFLENFKRPKSIETFRKSLEQVWGAVNRVERRERRKLRRRAISAAQFEEFAIRYAMAKTNYESGLNFYRTLVWHGKTGKSAPSG